MKKSLFVFCLCLLLVSACSPASPIPTPNPTAPFPQVTGESSKLVNFTTEDGIKLFATLYGEGSTVVILGHMGIGGVTQKSWQPFAQYIANLGFSALTLDFRGCGISEGGLMQKDLIYDVYAAVNYLREQGYEKIVCMGASMGGTACLRAAIDQNLDGVVMVSSPLSLGEPTSVNSEEVESLKIPSLFITAAGDPSSCLSDMQLMESKAPEPKQLIIYPDISKHGTDIFFTQYGTDFRDTLVNYLQMIK